MCGGGGEGGQERVRECGREEMGKREYEEERRTRKDGNWEARKR